MSITSATDYDVVIVGAGIVGLVMACALSASSLRVALLDQHNPETEPDHHLRVSAINLGSQAILTKLNVWQTLQKQLISPFLKIQVWDAQGDGALHFSSADISEPALGYIVENHNLQQALYQRLKRHSLIEFKCPAKLRHLAVHDDRVTLKLDLPKDYQRHQAHIGTVQHDQVLKDERYAQEAFVAKLVIAADGQTSVVRKLASMGCNVHDYQQTALVAQVRTALNHQQTAWQCFLPTGPLAFLPLKNPQDCSIVWSVPTKDAVLLQQLDDDHFCQRLAEAFRHRLGEVHQVSRRLLFPLYKRHAENYIKPCLALIGDAAHTLHPLAGQGLNLGIADAACLADVILTAHKKNRSIAALHTLRHYERARRSDVIAMLRAIDSLSYLFSSQNTAVRELRNMGLNAIDHFSVLKKCLMHSAVK